MATRERKRKAALTEETSRRAGRLQDQLKQKKTSRDQPIKADKDGKRKT